MLYGVPTPRRRDAQRNRSAILRAASELLLTGGAFAGMPEVARRAGVGQATLYRHFPDRGALIAAVVADRLALLESRGALPFRALLAEGLHTQAAMRRLDPESRRRLTARVVRTLGALLRRAQSAGEVRPDRTTADLTLLFMMLSASGEQSAQRSIELLLDAFCARPEQLVRNIGPELDAVDRSNRVENPE
ncbi:TetR/AcrR family transcriptional regulator [Dactylosporangium sp. NPDC051485]|uniref:TetR/AcrR family transcriptional regulator n=1 Tax=Dactylosporangium sp. NPDC051485 TaxID=3154846 RepID=UPI00341B8494